MGIIELFFLAVGVSMDAFAVSVCKGLGLGKIKFKDMLTAGFWFGGFQALMPTAGYLLGARFQQYITRIDHWIAFVLLVFIGAKMIKESRDSDGEVDSDLSAKTMFILAVATSIDALAVGITFAFLQVNIIWAALFIGCTTFAISAAGVKIGSIFGLKYKTKAEICGGAILILIGFKILLEHLGILA